MVDSQGPEAPANGLGHVPALRLFPQRREIDVDLAVGEQLPLLVRPVRHQRGLAHAGHAVQGSEPDLHRPRASRSQPGVELRQALRAIDERERERWDLVRPDVRPDAGRCLDVEGDSAMDPLGLDARAVDLPGQAVADVRGFPAGGGFLTLHALPRP